MLHQVRHEGKGFKTAFYEYYEQNEWDIGTHITRVYSIAINTYQRMSEIEKALDAVLGGEEFGIEESEMLMVLMYEAVIKEQRLRFGGRLPKIIKMNLENFKVALSGNG